MVSAVEYLRMCAAYEKNSSGIGYQPLKGPPYVPNAFPIEDVLLEEKEGVQDFISASDVAFSTTFVPDIYNENYFSPTDTSDGACPDSMATPIDARNLTSQSKSSAPSVRRVKFSSSTIDNPRPALRSPHKNVFKQAKYSHSGGRVADLGPNRTLQAARPTQLIPTPSYHGRESDSSSEEDNGSDYDDIQCGRTVRKMSTLPRRSRSGRASHPTGKAVASANISAPESRVAPKRKWNMIGIQKNRTAVAMAGSAGESIRNGSSRQVDGHLSGASFDLSSLLNEAQSSSSKRKEWRCPLKNCNIICKAPGDLGRHLESLAHKPPSYFCWCGSRYTRIDALKRHQVKRRHPPKTR